MAFGSSKNRRRVDTAKRKAQVADHARAHGPVALRFCAVLAISAALAYGGHTTWRWAIASPFFGLKALNFEGLDQATSAELRRLSGLGPGQNLFLLELPAIERAMLQHPWVRTVEVRRRFPSSVQVRVEEHVPVAGIVLGELYLVDPEGEPFKRVQPGDTFDLPLLTGVTREAYVADPLDAAARIREGLTVAERYRAASLERQAPLSEVRLEADGVTLVTGKDGQEVRLSTDAGAETFEKLASVRAELSRRSLQAEVIHLNNRVRPGWVAVKVAANGTERTGRPAQ